MQKDKIYINNKLIFRKTLDNICPVCKKIPEDYTLITYNYKAAKVCKKHFEFDENEKGVSTVRLFLDNNKEEE